MGHFFDEMFAYRSNASPSVARRWGRIVPIIVANGDRLVCSSSERRSPFLAFIAEFSRSKSVQSKVAATHVTTAAPKTSEMNLEKPKNSCPKARVLTTAGGLPVVRLAFTWAGTDRLIGAQPSLGRDHEHDVIMP